MIYLITGDGGGKTTQALGMALRAIGHKKKVVIVQFMKGMITGEVKALSLLKPYVHLRQFGRDRFVNLKKPSEDDKALAVAGLKYAEEVLDKKPFMLVLDELNLATAIGLVKVKDVLKLLKKAKKTHVVLTGRRAPSRLKKAADIVNLSKDSKRRKMPSRPGIEY